MQEAGARLAAQNLERQVQHENLYESPAFRVSHEGLQELLAEVKRVEALITAKPPGHPVSPLLCLSKTSIASD
jgi:tRNA pseudouridine-54 N-methylase